MGWELEYSKKIVILRKLLKLELITEMEYILVRNTFIDDYNILNKK